MTYQFKIDRPFSMWHLLPQEAETGYGFFMRMVAAEGLPSAQAYAAAIGLRSKNKLAPEVLETLFKLPLPDEAKSSLRQWTASIEGDFYRLSGCRIRQKQLSTWRRRFCPGCLAEAPHHRAWWDIVSVRACPLHGCKLESTCSDGRRLAWWWPDFTTDQAGAPLGKAMPRIDGKHMFEHYVLRKLGLIHDDVGHPLLAEAELYEVIEICGHIGRFLGHPWIRDAPAVHPVKRPYQIGFDALSGTLDELAESLRAWLERNSEQTFGVGLDRGYGWLRRGASTVTKLNPRWVDIDHAQRMAYAAFSKMGRKNVNTRRLTFKYLSLVDVARKYGTRPERLKEFLLDVGMLPEDLFFTHEETEAIGAAIAALLTQTEAAKFLGCKPRMMESIGRSGLLSSYTHFRGRRVRLFRGEQVEELAERLDSLPTSGSTGRRISLWTYCAEEKISEIEGMNRVLSGHIVPAARRGNAVGFNALRLAVAPPNEVFLSKVAEGEITFGRAKAMLGLTQETIPALVVAGVLEAGRPGDTRPHLKLSSIEEFRARYVNAAAYRKELGCGTNAIVQALDRLGVTRHFADIPGVKDNIVERQEFFRAAGIVEMPEGLRRTWEDFRSIVEEVCPAFLLPATLTSQPQTFFNITRLTRFTVEVEGGAVVVRKRFNRKASREWAWMLSHRQEVYGTLGVMRLRKAVGSDEIVGAVVLDSKDVMRKLAEAMADYHWLLLKKEIR